MPVSARAEVEKALFFELTPSKVKELIKKYGKEICIDMSYYPNVKDKKYCTLIFLKDVKEVEPFRIDKKGYGNMAAWIMIEKVEKIRIT